MSDIVFISNARLSFPHFAEPQRMKNEVTGQERISYNCELLLAPDTPGVVAFMRRYRELAQAKWAEHAPQVMQMIQQDRKSRCYGNGDEKINKKTFKPYDGYAGNFYITAGRDTQPQVIQADGTPIDPTNTMAYQQLTRKMYGGCRINAAIKPWAQQNKHGNGIRCDLVAIQFAGDDTPFGEGATDASAMFGSVASASAGMFGAAPQAAAAMPPAPFGAPTKMPWEV
jgi:hypothetical protein